jgi:hypothetical protein
MRVAQHLAGGGDIGRMQLRNARKRLHGCIVAHHEIEHGTQKLRVCRGRPQRLRANAAFGQKQPQSLRVASNKTQRLNCNDFSHFAGVVNRLFQYLGLPFR